MMYLVHVAAKPKQTAKSRQWTVGEARAHLPELFKAAGHQPQRVFRRKQPAAVVVSPSEFEELAALRTESEEQTLADAFAELRGFEDGLNVGLEVPQRCDRKSGFPDGGR
jgi:PHD/YefM family antitoxin component YafN of YafNO toxin-antitoxin module